jgi:hypothetical protein
VAVRTQHLRFDELDRLLEQIARVIDPNAWFQHDSGAASYGRGRQAGRQIACGPSIAKANVILRILPPVRIEKDYYGRASTDPHTYWLLKSRYSTTWLSDYWSVGSGSQSGWGTTREIAHALCFGSKIGAQFYLDIIDRDHPELAKRYKARAYSVAGQSRCASFLQKREDDL